MSNPKIILALLAFSLTTKSNSQKLTFKDLEGTWDAFDTSKSAPPFSIKFIDSFQCMLESMSMPMGKQFTYSIDASGPTSALYLKGITVSGTKFTDIWLIKKQGNDTLKFQSQVKYNAPASVEKPANPLVWEDKETYKNTGTFIRRKN